LDVYSDERSLLHIGDDTYYLQSMDYEEDGTGVGFKIDLSSGLITANSLSIKTDYFTLSTEPEDPYF
jgi:hypothetical protein